MKKKLEAGKNSYTHLKGENQIQVNIYKCDQCDKSFDTKKGMTIHIVKTHKDTIPQLNGQTEKIAADETVQTCNVEKHDVKEIIKSPSEIEHLKRFGMIDTDFWCFKCDKEYISPPLADCLKLLLLFFLFYYSVDHPSISQLPKC